MENLELILGLVTLVFIGKFLIITPLVKIFRYPLKTALICGLGLAQIGEFSFVLASEGQQLGLVSRRVYLLILGTTAVTLVLTPFVLRLLPILFDWAETMPWLQPYLNGEGKPLEVADDLPIKDHIIVCGYGRVGKNLVKVLLSHQLPVIVIDQSERIIQQLREAKIPYVYGNCVSFHVLQTAGINRAKAMAIALPDPMSTRLTLRRGLELFPELNIVVRATNNKNIEALYQLGAREVVQPEFEASLEMVSFLLTDIGLSAVLVQQEIQQIRQSHYLDFRPEQSASEAARALRRATADLNKRWYTLPTNSPLVGMTLEQADMRYLTGVSLMAIQRIAGEEIDYPDAKTILEEGDRLLVVGSSEEIAALEEFASGKATVPGENSACQWVKLDSESPVLGKTLADLDIRRQYAVEIQAIRREGKFLRYPESKTRLQNRDQLLLCGRLSALNKLEELFSCQNQPVLSIPIVKAAELEALREYLPLDDLRE